jgi:hypothetical protein
MSRGRPLVRAACAVAISTASGGALAAQASIPVKAGITVAPDSVRIGDPFRVTVGIRAPRGATIEFPRATDSTSTVQSLDPVEVRTAADTTAVEQYADYRVAAWDVGVQRIRLDDAIVRYNGVDRRIPLSGDSVFVRSLLPATPRSAFPNRRALYSNRSCSPGGYGPSSPRPSSRSHCLCGGGFAVAGAPRRPSSLLRSSVRSRSFSVSRRSACSTPGSAGDM